MATLADLAVVPGGLLGDPQQGRGPQRRAERPAVAVVAAGQRVQVLAQRALAPAPRTAAGSRGVPVTSTCSRAAR